MFFLIGLVVVVGSVLGGYMPHGDVRVLWQPLEVLIICGAAFGGFIIANPKTVIIGAGKHLGRVMKGGVPYKKEAYLDLLTLQYSLYKLAKTKGALALEQHIETPEDSTLFQNHPDFLKNTQAVEFLCDTLRLITMGTENPHELQEMMEIDIETRKHEAESIAHAITAVSEGLPAFGIVAAVLGVIVTMGSISEPPEVLGALIGGALVGTFLGVLLSYGIVGPIGSNLEGYANAEFKYFECMKAGILAYVSGYAPAVSVEFARKTLYSHERPTFFELDEATANALPV